MPEPMLLSESCTSAPARVASAMGTNPRDATRGCQTSTIIGNAYDVTPPVQRRFNELIETHCSGSRDIGLACAIDHRFAMYSTLRTPSRRAKFCRPDRRDCILGPIAVSYCGRIKGIDLSVGHSLNSEVH